MMGKEPQIGIVVEFCVESVEDGGVSLVTVAGEVTPVSAGGATVVQTRTDVDQVGLAVATTRVGARKPVHDLWAVVA